MESIDILRELILATDLANHFRIFKDLKKLNADNVQNHQRMLLSLLISCCDLNDQIKTWTTVYRVAELVYTEFFTQGDLEKQMGMSPNLMFDRKKANVPALQIEFLDAVVKPTYEIFVQIFPETSQFLETITENRQHWVEIKEKEENCCKNGNSC
jgi:cGMP-dependent 3',5'-cyclic phosphodiesterase